MKEVIVWNDLSASEQALIKELSSYTGSLGKRLYSGVDVASSLNKKGLIAVRKRRERTNKHYNYYYRLTALGREIAE